jgi:hypothetical protein
VKNYPQGPIKDTGGGVAGAERGGHEIIRPIAALYTDKREIKFSSYIRKFRVKQLQRHI